MNLKNDTVNRIEKINNQFLQLLESMNTDDDDKFTPYLSKQSTNSSTDFNYHEKIIEHSRKINEIPKHAFTLDEAEYRMEIDKKLDDIYISKQLESQKNKVYDIRQICASNAENMITIPFKVIPKEQALTVKRSLVDALLADVNLNQKIDIWGPIKKFCSIQIKL